MTFVVCGMYDLAGHATSWTSPGPTLTYTINAAGQTTAITSSYSGADWPATLIENVTYTPFGGVSSLQNGCVGCSAVNQETYVYNNRLQPVLIEMGTSAHPYGTSCLVYDYYTSVSV